MRKTKKISFLPNMDEIELPISVTGAFQRRHLEKNDSLRKLQDS